jgi:Mn2+/Fe2+ NRAMP family transporter
MEELFGLLGLALIVFVVALVKLGPDWGDLLGQAAHPNVPDGETAFTYAYFGIALFGAAMTPYEVFFFSAGAVEERWTADDLATERANVFVGFPLGGILSLAIMATASLVFLPVDISVGTLPVVGLPVAAAVGKIGLAVVIVGIFAATFGAALETALSAGYTVAQYLGWQWGKFVAPKDAARFHAVVLLSILAGMLLIESGVDPIKVTEYSIVLSAAALPLTYFPILVIANDPDYMGVANVNGRVRNAFAVVYLVLLVAVAVAAIPLIIITKGGA